jgi:phage tail protein X
VVKHAIHRTQEGDRWDTLAWKYYGDGTKLEPLFEANPGVPRYAVLPGNQEIIVPVIAQETKTIPDSKLPPWKRKAVA